MNRAVGVGMAVTFVAFLIYRATLCPTIFAGDAGELATAASTLGIAHPPGYPVYTLLGRLAVLAFPGEPAFALNLFSALAMAAAAGLVGVLLSVWSGGAMVPAGVALAFAVSHSVWSSAVTTEVYALNLLFTTAALLAAVLARRSHDGLFVLAAYLIGLGAGNHAFVVLAGPPVLALTLAPNGRRQLETARARWLRLPWMAVFFAVGLTAYLYLPVRLAAGPEMSWAHLRSLGDVLDHVLRAQYGGLGEASADASFGVRLRVFLEVLAAGVPVPLWIAAAIGMGILARAGHSRRVGVLVGFFLIAGPLTAAAIRYEDTFLDHSVVTVFFLPAVLAMFLMVGAGCAGITEAVATRLGEQRSAALLVTGAVAFLPALMLWDANRDRCDRRASTFAADYARTVLGELPPNAWLFTKGDNACFSLYYAHHALGLRPDVTLVDRSLNLDVGAYGDDFPAMTRTERRDTRAARETEIVFGDVDRPVFLTEDTDATAFPGCRAVPAGYVAQLLRPGERPFDGDHRADPLPPIDRDDFLECHFAAATLYREGLWLVHRRRDDEARDRYVQAAELAARIPPILRNVGLAHLELGDLAEAERLFVRVIEMDPENEDALYNVAVLCAQTGRGPESIDWFERIVRLGTEYPEVPMGYALELLKVGRLEDALAQARSARAIAPELESAQRLEEVLQRGLEIGGDAGVLEAQQALGSSTADGTLQLAQRYLDRGDVARATDLYREAAARSPTSISAAYGLGYGLLQAGRYGDAAAAFRRVLELDPASADGRNALAYILAQTGDSLDVAERLALEALELSPDLAAYWKDTLGWVRYRTGELEQALGDLRESADLLPADDFAMRSENHYHLGSVLSALHRVPEAREHFARSAALSVEGPWIPDREARMRELGMAGGTG